MILKSIRVAALVCGLCALLVACQPDAPQSISPTADADPALEIATLVLSITPVPTLELFITAAPGTPSPMVTLNTTATMPPTQAPETPTPTATSSPTQEPSATPIIERRDHFVLQRPISQGEGRTDWVDRSYPYGGTQFGQREVHLGVEFFNPRFTSVQAAADGVVIFAGSDEQALIGPMPDYYGRVIVIQHELSTLDQQTVFTLYGHLQEIDVHEGQTIRVGERIGSVGDSGIAIGPHLHFEMRAGAPFDYRATRNPELWIQPYRGFGVLAGRVTTPRVTDAYGVVVYVRSTTLNRETYVYGSDRVNSDPVWNENFTLGDLPEGTYEVLIANRSGRVYFRQAITIEAGRSAWIEIPLENIPTD